MRTDIMDMLVSSKIRSHAWWKSDADLYARERLLDSLPVPLMFATSLCVLAFAVAVQSPVVVVAFFLFGAIGLRISRRWGVTESRLFAAVYCWNVLAVIVLYVIYLQRYGAPYYIGGSDDLAFEQWAQVVASHLGVLEYSSIRGNFVSLSHNSVGYVYLVSLLYRASEPLGGFHTLLPRLLNSLTLALLAVLVFRMARSLLKLRDSTAVGVSLAVGLAPIMMYYSAHTFRDIIMAFLIFILVYAWNSYAARSSRSRLVLLLGTPLCILALWEMRNFSAVAAAGLVLLSWYKGHRSITDKKKVSVPLLGVGFLAILMYVLSTGGWEWFLGRSGRYYESYTEYRMGLSSGLAQFVFGAPQPLSSFLRILYLSISPFPVFSTQPDDLWLSLGTIIQIFFLPFLGIGLWRLIREKRALPVWIGFLGLFVGVALLSFSGRQITMYYPFGALVVGYGYDFYRKKGYRVEGAWLVMYWAGTLGAMAYIYLKVFA